MTDEEREELRELYEQLTPEQQRFITQLAWVLWERQQEQEGSDDR